MISSEVDIISKSVKIITGYLDINENDKLRQLISKQPKYVEANKINWNRTETMISKVIDSFALQWFKREQTDVIHLAEWKKEL